MEGPRPTQPCFGIRRLIMWPTIWRHAWRYLVIAPGLFYLFYVAEILIDGSVPSSADFAWWIDGVIAAYAFGSIPSLIIAVLVGAAAHKYPLFNALFYSILLFLMARLSLAFLSDTGKLRDPVISDYFFSVRAFWIHIPAAFVGAVCSFLSYPRRPQSAIDLADRFS